MPKRILDGEGLWRSDKLARVQPDWIKAEFANLVPLATANGVFETNARRIWCAVYSYNRPEITVEQVEEILAEFTRVRLLFRWTDESGRVWGYWTGIDKPGRLPGKSRRGRNEVVGPEPPRDDLQSFLETNGIREALNGSSDLPGLGLGSGSGSGINLSAHPSDEPEHPTSRLQPSLQAQLAELANSIYTLYPRKVGRDDALKSIIRAIRKIAVGGASDRHGDFSGNIQGAAEWLRNRVILYGQSPQGSQTNKTVVPYPATWMNKGRYEDDEQEWEHISLITPHTDADACNSEQTSAVVEGEPLSEIEQARLDFARRKLA
jgi:hypothetical protein